MSTLERIKMLVSLENVPDSVTVGRIRDVLNGEAPEDLPQSIAPGPPLPEIHRSNLPASEMTIFEYFAGQALAAMRHGDFEDGYRGANDMADQVIYVTDAVIKALNPD